MLFVSTYRLSSAAVAGIVASAKKHGVPVHLTKLPPYAAACAAQGAVTLGTAYTPKDALALRIRFADRRMFKRIDAVVPPGSNSSSSSSGSGGSRGSSSSTRGADNVWRGGDLSVDGAVCLAQHFVFKKP